MAIKKENLNTKLIACSIDLKRQSCSRCGLLLAILICLALHLPTALAETSCDGHQLPANVQEILNHRFPQWHIVSLSDLRTEDQSIWSSAHPGECPGFVEGSFEGSAKKSYAVTLLRRRSKQIYQVLVVITEDAKNYQLHVLSKPQEVDVVSVVTKLKPGRYLNSRGNLHIRTKFSVVSYETIEAGAIYYYWENGRYRSIQASE